MRGEQAENGENSTHSQSEILIHQLKEITGIHDPQVLYRALKASQGDIGHAVGLLTTETPEVQDPGEMQEPGTTTEAWEGQKGIPKDELQTAIELSLQESQHANEEEREFHRALEASVEENAARMKRKRSEAQSEMSSPADWLRHDDWPVGIRNIGNTCWFSAVIQSLFHLPVFRKLVLNYHLSERVLEKCKSNADKRNLAFMQELRCLFALMVGSSRRFVDPSASVELLRDAFRTSEAQQDVSEFSHKLLDWLEDAFQLAANGKNAEDKQKNPMVQLFYGTFVTERRHEGKTLCNIEQFGQYPLQVNGFNNLDECLEGAMVERDIESLHPEHSATSARERWFKKLPPVLTFELSRFEFNAQLGRPEKIHKKLEFPQIMYMDRYLHKNIEQTHERRGEVKKLKDQLAALQQKLECYKNYGSGPSKYPLADVLQFALEFATTKPSSVSPAEDLRATSPSPIHLTETNSKDNSDSADPDSEGLASSVSSCQRTPIYKPFTQHRPPVDCPPHPAPHSATDEELHYVKTCLQRWRTEVENDIIELKASIDRLSQMLEGMYTDNNLCQVPYRLHAVLVHEGQASAGHYWAYIYDHANQRWMKYNDMCITESTWEELERESFGGMTNASAYCLMYIDDRLPQLITDTTDDETGQVLHGLDSLPSVLRRYVNEDNRWFQQELSEWQEQFSQNAAPQGESTATSAAADPQNPNPDPNPNPETDPNPDHDPITHSEDGGPQTEEEPASQSEDGVELTDVAGPSKEDPEVEATSESQPEPEEDKETETEPTEKHEEESELKSLSPSPLETSGCHPDDSSSATVTDTMATSQSATQAEKEIQSQTPVPESDLSNQATTSELPNVPIEKSDTSPSVTADLAPRAEETPEEESTQEVSGTEQEVVPARSRPRPSEDVVSEVDIPNVGRITVRADADGYNEEMMLTPAMQGVIMAIAKARQIFDTEGPEAGLIKAFHEEYARLYELSTEETTPQDDPRLHHSLVYFFQNKAPKRIIERTLLEQFTDRNLSFDERAISIMREARTKLRLIKPDDMDMDEYLQWHDDYKLFRTVFVYLLTGLEHYQHGKMREALTYLAHAYETNSNLLKNGEKRGMEKSLIGNYRRKCLTALNASASRLFCSGVEQSVSEAVSLMDEVIIPCLHLMSRDRHLSPDDRDAMETIRSNWCSCLGQDMEASLQVKLGEFLPRVLEGSGEAIALKDPPDVPPTPAHELCDRLAAVMESIHKTSVVAVQ